MSETRSISDDDLCSACYHCKYNPGNLPSEKTWPGVYGSECEREWPGQFDEDGYCGECSDFLNCGPCLRQLTIETNTFPSEWEEIDGQDTHKGTDHYYRNRETGKEAYVNMDQGEITVSIQ